MACCLHGVFIPQVTDCAGLRPMLPGELLRIGDALYGYEFVHLLTSRAVHRNAFIVADASAGAITITLPPVEKGLAIIVKKVDDSNDVILDGFESETIDGETTFTLSTQYQAATAICDGSVWHLV